MQTRVEWWRSTGLRRRWTASGRLLDVGADIVTVQHLLGHANPRTTSRYDRRPEEAKRQAVAKLFVPYRRR
jgi:integrase